MAATLEETQGTDREGRVYTPLPDSERTQRLHSPVDSRYEEEVVLLLSPRLRWGGLAAGVVAAFAVIFLLTMLGIAIGLSTLDNPLLSSSESAQNFATTAGIWTGIIALIAYFVAGMVSTKVTDRPDGGALLHGTLAWMLLSMTLSWLATSGITIGLGGLPSGMPSSMNWNALPMHPNTFTEADMAQSLGLTDPSQLMAPANDERMVSALATTTNMSREEAQTALDDLRARVATVQTDPEAVQAEIRAFLSQMLVRAQQQAPAVAANAQRQMEKGSWMTFAVMSITLLVAIMGAKAGIPNIHHRSRLVFRH
jgi:hypothetical protein